MSNQMDVLLGQVDLVLTHRHQLQRNHPQWPESNPTGSDWQVYWVGKNERAPYTAWSSYTLYTGGVENRPKALVVRYWMRAQ